MTLGCSYHDPASLIKNSVEPFKCAHSGPFYCIIGKAFILSSLYGEDPHFNYKEKLLINVFILLSEVLPSPHMLQYEAGYVFFTTKIK